MTEEENRQRRFWPILILGAFALGFVLWGFWMVRAIQQPRPARDMNYAPVPAAEKSATTNQPGTRSP